MVTLVAPVERRDGMDISFLLVIVPGQKLNRTVFPGELSRDSEHHSWSRLTAILLLFALGRRDTADRGEEPPVVEPIDPFEGSKLYRFDVPPRATTVDDLGLVESDNGLGQAVIRVAAAADRGLDACLGELFSIANREVLTPRSVWCTSSGAEPDGRS